VALLTLDVAVCRVLFRRRGERLVGAHLAGQTHALPIVAVAGSVEEVGYRIVEAVRTDGVPGAQEDDVGHEDFVFEGCSVVAFGLAEGFFDLTSDAGHGLDGCAFEFGNL